MHVLSALFLGGSSLNMHVPGAGCKESSGLQTCPIPPLKKKKNKVSVLANFDRIPFKISNAIHFSFQRIRLPSSKVEWPREIVFQIVWACLDYTIVCGPQPSSLEWQSSRHPSLNASVPLMKEICSSVAM